VTKSWYGKAAGLSTYTKFPKRFFYPVDFFSTSNNASQMVYDDWFAKFEAVTGMERVAVNMSNPWLATSGTSQPLAIYMNESYVYVTAYDQTQWAKRFIGDNKEEFGHIPYINPAPRVKI
jgi:hypothetical protein